MSPDEFLDVSADAWDAARIPAGARRGPTAPTRPPARPLDTSDVKWLVAFVTLSTVAAWFLARAALHALRFYVAHGHL
jgi:hypothetical protein